LKQTINVIESLDISNENENESEKLQRLSRKRELDEEVIDDDDQNPRKKFEQEDFDRQYTAERRLGQISSASAMIAILLSCLGLLGLITHSIGRRTKEIGIRKVLGASVASVTGLLTMDFLKLVVVAIFIASPIAWYVMHQWLENFAYHIGIEWWMFVVAGALALLIAFLTVCVQSVRAALANPVEVLKSE
jgi:putative ABC transport system permease protein